MADVPFLRIAKEQYRKIFLCFNLNVLHQNAADEYTKHEGVMRILIVDDEPINRLLLKKILKHVAVCDEAVNGQEAVEAFIAAFEKKHYYDLLVLDIMMPVMDGAEALNTIRHYELQNGTGETGNIDVLITSTLTVEDTLVKSCLNWCCTDYIGKPVNKRELFEKFTNYHFMPDREPGVP